MNPLLLLAALMDPTPKTLVFADAVIVASQPTPVGCGIRKMWGAVDFKYDGVTERAYVACGTAGKLPAVGSRCAITVSVAAIDGGTVDGRQSSPGGYAVDDFQCSAPVATGKPELFEGVPVELHGATIIAWGAAPMADSGFIWFVHRLTVADSSGARRMLYQTYARNDDVPPARQPLRDHAPAPDAEGIERDQRRE